MLLLINPWIGDIRVRFRQELSNLWVAAAFVSTLQTAEALALDLDDQLIRLSAFLIPDLSLLNGSQIPPTLNRRTRLTAAPAIKRLVQKCSRKPTGAPIAVTRTIFWPPFGPFPSYVTNRGVISSDSHTHILAGDQKRKHKLAACFFISITALLKLRDASQRNSQVLRPAVLCDHALRSDSFFLTVYRYNSNCFHRTVFAALSGEFTGQLAKVWIVL